MLEIMCYCCKKKRAIDQGNFYKRKGKMIFYCDVCLGKVGIASRS